MNRSYFPGVSDKLFVDGINLTSIDDLIFLSDPYEDRPSLSISEEKMTEFVNANDRATRHYKCFQISLWEDALIQSSLLKFSKTSQNLYVEANNLLLPPLKEEIYKAVDSLGKNIYEILFESFAKFIFLLAFSPFRLVVNILPYLGNFEEEREIRKLIT